DTTRLCVQGSVEALRENPHGAAALFARAIEIDPTALDAYRLLAGIHFENQRPAEARAVLEQARAAVTENDLTLLFTDLCRAHRAPTATSRSCSGTPGARIVNSTNPKRP